MRRRQTWLVVAAFVLGTIAVPTLHLTFHTLPHEHSGGNAGHHHHHDGPRHGDASAAHYSLAISDGAATIVHLLPAVLTEAGRVAPASETSTVAAHVSVQRFRGPPARV